MFYSISAQTSDIFSLPNYSCEWFLNHNSLPASLLLLFCHRIAKNSRAVKFMFFRETRHKLLFFHCDYFIVLLKIDKSPHTAGFFFIIIELIHKHRISQVTHIHFAEQKKINTRRVLHRKKKEFQYRTPSVCSRSVIHVVREASAKNKNYVQVVAVNLLFFN